MKRLVSVLATIGVVAVIMISVTRSHTISVSTPVSHYQTSSRQVVVSDQATVSRGDGPVVVQLVSGQIPANVSTLTVLSDENCQPDQNGVSHCLNRVQFQGGQGSGEATLQHHHKFSEESCLTPGETLQLVR